VIEQGIRYPGFAFVNVQSPCVTYGQPEQQLKALKQTMRSLRDLGHDETDRLRAMALAQEYGERLYTGVFYREAPRATYEARLRETRQARTADLLPRERILEIFRP
jgi:2-oxoglutarate ferredoxin oxidoreductase subunit beta